VTWPWAGTTVPSASRMVRSEGVSTRPQRRAYSVSMNSDEAPLSIMSMAGCVSKNPANLNRLAGCERTPFRCSSVVVRVVADGTAVVVVVVADGTAVVVVVLAGGAAVVVIVLAGGAAVVVGAGGTAVVVVRGASASDVLAAMGCPFDTGTATARSVPAGPPSLTRWLDRSSQPCAAGIRDYRVRPYGTQSICSHPCTAEPSPD
jgi:hypothetical protein